MPPIAISVEKLSKSYLVGHQASNQMRNYTALRDVLARNARELARKTRDMLRGRPIVQGDTVEEFWALQDVSFEVRQGERVGIIGRNGAGKSTLLKVLSRITEPTHGRIRIAGRVASLLEVGTGFHPELTGRENIYLNGAILGMSRAEVRRKFDEIVDFAGVETFLDTPVKRFSSGMYVRLAFAVAAHLETEVLVVDEVLAVGDAEFQRKCLGKMSDLANAGRTVLFVSHNLPAVKALCSRAMLLAGGRVQHDGEVSEIIAEYLGGSYTGPSLSGRRIDATMRLENCDIDGAPAYVAVFDVTLRGPLARPHVGIGINDAEGARITTLLSEMDRLLPDLAEGEVLSLQVEAEPMRLAPGTVMAKIIVLDQRGYVESYDDALQLIVPDYMPFKRAPFSRPAGPVLSRARVIIKSGHG
jgi:ABC-type polysaccharide/polyol phosphate transport system ATPase subunit